MRSAIPTTTSRWGVAERNPASPPYFFEIFLKVILFGAGGGVTGMMHAVEMLGEKVFAVGFVTASSCWLLCLLLRIDAGVER